VSRVAYHVLHIVCAVVLLAACSFPGSVKPTVKIGLSAPFEGLYRDLGYEALHAVRLAVQQRNETEGVGGRYWVELVALNDFNEPEDALVQAGKMAVDNDVLGVLGGWSEETAVAVAPEYERLGIPFLTPEMDWTAGDHGQPVPVDPQFAANYEALSGGAPPGPAAVWAYLEANRLLEAIDAATRAEGQPTRAGVLVALTAVR
jgi:ABC-type branched-subunit amino acid transport system substrate-binding protein